jgi:drug/metabolite transporter (DMT)-like permease
MNYILIALGAYLFNSLSILADKFLLTKKAADPLNYIFYISLLSLLTLVVIPFSTPPNLTALLFSSLYTLLWSVGAYFLFKALQVGLASRVAPIIGTLNPVFLVLYYFLIQHTISLNEVWGAIFLMAGLMVIVLPYLRSHQSDISAPQKRKEILYEVLAGLLFATSYIFLKEAYNHSSFLTVMGYSRLVLLPILLVIVLIPSLRRITISAKGEKIHFKSKNGLLFLGGQLAGGLSQFLLTFAISMANPALVNALQGTQYAFLFLLSLILTKHYSKIFDEPLTRKSIQRKVAGLVFIALGLYILAFAHNSPLKTTLGVTYSPRYAEGLDLDPKVTFISMLDDLNPKSVRIPIYWDLIEPERGRFDFTDSDYYIRELDKRGVKATLVVGLKVPRFPECYFPSWTKGMTQEEIDQLLYQEITQVVNHYQNSPSLDVWQVENEPLFPFGVCPKADMNRLKKEVELVRELDPKHQIMITESGEYGLWLNTASLSDIVGTTLYRRTLAPYIPQFKSPLPPFFYQAKGQLVGALHPGKKIYVSELQAEPWANQPLQTTTYDYQKLSFPLEDLEENIEFAKEAGFDTVYVWGVEWWYYLNKLGHSEYLNSAILIFNDIK